jgi:glycerol-3-phosphate dehydrogenase
MRTAALERLQTETFDILILGGGINGAGVARDLALRARRSGTALSIGLLEQKHFGSGTSGKNSQLIHGGLRYLKNFELGLVREALHERALILKMAPRLASPLPFLLPVHGLFGKLYYHTGLTTYDTLAGKRNIARHRGVSSEELARLEPDLSPEFRGALRFFDGRIHSARFVLANVQHAIRNGVAAANHARAEGWERAGECWRVAAADTLSGERFEIRARKLIDTTGPWTGASGLRLVRGSHLVMPRLNSSDHAIAWFEPSGRIIFVIPWGENNDLSLVGTTDVDHDSGPDNVRISEQEEGYLLGVVKTLYPRAGTAEPISGFTSLRPLVRDEASSATRTSREHRIWNSEDGLLRVAGGKYTTYRVMSEQAADLALSEVAPALQHLHVTTTEPLPLDEPEDGSIGGRIAHAVSHEMAQRLTDLMFVSTYWGYERRWDRESLAPYAEAMGRHLGWDDRRREEEIEAVLCAVPFSAR